MTSDEGDGKDPDPPAPEPVPPTVELEPTRLDEPPLETMPVVAVPAVASTDDLREAVGVGRLDEKAARKAEKEAAKAAGRERVRLQKEAKARARAEADSSKRELDDDDRDDDELDDAAPKKRTKTLLVVALALALGGVIATFVLLGRSNSDRFLLTCGPKHAVAQQGRTFPPWGERGLSGAQWKAIPIPPGAECESRETEDVHELAGWYLEMLQDQALLKLTGREVTEVDEAERELQQALMLAQDPEFRDQRHELERLLGDVDYWRAKARVEAASKDLEAAAKQFEAAADRRPRNQTDAAAWAKFLHDTAADVLAGPGGVRRDTVGQTDVAKPDKPDVPTGVALPVEEPAQDAPDAGVAAPPIDAGLPQGGVLL